jgi:methionine salvage enolase-phosphatase E1
MHAFTVSKASKQFGNTDLVENELDRALKIRTLFLAELPEAFRPYVHSLHFEYVVDDEGETTLFVHVHMVLQDPGAEVSASNGVVVLNDAIYDQMVARTTVSLIAGVLDVGVREGGEYAQQYRDAVQLLKR